MSQNRVSVFTSSPTIGWKLKDHEERSLPIPDPLLNELREPGTRPKDRPDVEQQAWATS